MLVRIVLIVVILLIAIQFIRPAENIHPGPRPNAIEAVYTIPDSVKTILDKACYDCHSNNTRYPWYNKIQPVAWWLNHHVNEGKQELNFDEFQTYPLKKKKHKLEEVEETVNKGEMPLPSYLWIHKDAVLSPAEKKTLIDWATSLKAQLQ